MKFRKPQPIRLVVADDRPILREGVRRMLEAEPGHKVIGEASDGAEAVKLVRELTPDILLLDLVMPKHPGMEALTRTKYPRQRDANKSDRAYGCHREAPHC